MKACEKIKNGQQFNDSFLEFYEKIILIIRHIGVVGHFSTQNYSYKILKINDCSINDQISAIDLKVQESKLDLDRSSHFTSVSNYFLNKDQNTLKELTFLKEQQEKLNKDFYELTENNKSSYEILEVSLEELETRFDEIVSFFSSIKSN